MQIKSKLFVFTNKKYILFFVFFLLPDTTNNPV